MEKEINIAEILQSKPKDTKLYSPVCGECFYKEIDKDTNKHIRTMADGWEHYFDSKGKIGFNGECLLFPSSSMRDWTKFAWKKGDVLVSNDRSTEVIFDHWYDNTYLNFYGKHYLCSEDEDNIKYSEDFLCCTNRYSLEEKDAAQCYINTIEKKFEGKLNMETLEIEHNKPKWWTPKPFDKVVVRDKDSRWSADFFSFKGSTFVVCIGGSWDFCLPYNEETAKLIGTTNNYKED